jgi:hypothetical protein
MNDLIEKPTYMEGDCVRFDIDETIKGEGRIRGRSVTGPTDFWIVQIERRDPTWDYGKYPYSSIAVPNHYLWRITGFRSHMGDQGHIVTESQVEDP